MIPLGVTEVRSLTQEARDLLAFPYKRKYWNNPWMSLPKFVAEMRDGELWMGVYLDGEDGKSDTKGNDPDDLNSWGQNGFDFYEELYAEETKEMDARRLEQKIEKAFGFTLYPVFTFFIFMWSFRKRDPLEGEVENCDAIGDDSEETKEPSS